ncbi:MAG: rRNA methyltransferase [Caldilineaceae bacterium]|nr:rRNA methyltransferase [Caldilineaceae bacterium]
MSSPLIVVLDRPQNPANIGAVVRAMRNLDVGTLRLVDPAPFAREDLLRYAHRCEEQVAAITVYADVADAVADAIYVVGTAALVHPDRPYTSDVRGLAAELTVRGRTGSVALLFGTEGDGLDRAALDHCHLVASLPVNPDYPALNLAQSVLLFLYELRLARETPLPLPSFPAESAAPARQVELEQLFRLTEALLHDVDYFRYSPETVMRSLRNLAYRAELTSDEAAMLMGMVRKLMQRMQ